MLVMLNLRCTVEWRFYRLFHPRKNSKGRHFFYRKPISKSSIKILKFSGVKTIHSGYLQGDEFSCTDSAIHTNPNCSLQVKQLNAGPYE